MMNLIKKLEEKRKIVIGALSLIGLVGCEMTQDEATGLRVIGGMAQVSPYTTPGERVLGKGMDVAGQMAHEKQVAREGRDQINLNIYGRNINNSKDVQISSIFFDLMHEAEKNGISFFVHKDINGDGAIDMNPGTREIIPTRVFYSGDNMNIVTVIPPYVPSINFNIFDNKLDERFFEPNITKRREEDSPDLASNLFFLTEFDVKKIIFRYKIPMNGTREYSIRLFGTDKDIPFANQRFYINFDLTSNQINR